MIRFIMLCTFSPGWMAGRAPPGRRFTGVSRAHMDTKMYAPKYLNQGFGFLCLFTNRSSQLSSFAISATPVGEGAGSASAQFTRDFVGVPTGTEDRIPGGFDST